MNLELWTPPNDWAGQDAFLIGGGPSLRQFNFGLLRGRNVIGCNDAYRLGKDIIRYCVFGDGSWWNHWRHQIEKSDVEFVTNAPSIINYNLPNVRNMIRENHGIHSGHSLGWNYSTGALAINLAVSLGATRVFLLGYDLTNNGQYSHWHEYNQKTTKEYAFERFVKGFKRSRNVSRKMFPS